MTRFIPGLRLGIHRSYLLLLAFGFLAVTLIGCQGGIDIIPLSARIQNADTAFEKAEAVVVRSDEPEVLKKQRAKKQELYDKAMTLYIEVLEKAPGGKYAQRAHYQIAAIYKKRYEWDQATEHYEAIVTLDPTGYYASEAKSGIDSIRRNREIINAKRAEYQNYKAIYDTEPTEETFNIAAEALYRVAQAYESLENYPQAIETYKRVVAEFAEHEKASQSQFQIGNIYFYEMYDYTNSGGWGAFVAVVQKFPDSYEASRAETLLKKTADLLTENDQLQAEIQQNTSKKAKEFQAAGREVLPSELYLMGSADLVVQCFQQIARNWVKLRNYPFAIQTYATLATNLSYRKYAAADALFQKSRLYQENGNYQRAIESYEELFDKAPESIWRNEGVYQQAICFSAIREFSNAYEGFKTYMSLSKGDSSYFREAEQRVRQYELDQDQDGYKFYVEQEHGTSDQDPKSYPGAAN